MTESKQRGIQPTGPPLTGTITGAAVATAAASGALVVVFFLAKASLGAPAMLARPMRTEAQTKIVRRAMTKPFPKRIV